ncbi:hypothetical protein ACFLQU_05085 [Verrucomicrobiota bacterium]
MLYNIRMPRGASGRIVLEIDPSEKRQLYRALDKDGITLKNWFLRQLGRYMEERVQPELFSRSASVRGRKKGKKNRD